MRISFETSWEKVSPDAPFVRRSFELHLNQRSADKLDLGVSLSF